MSAKTQRRLSVVLTPSEVRALLVKLRGTMHLVAALLYGTGLRLLEGLRLRVKVVEFTRCDQLSFALRCSLLVAHQDHIGGLLP